MLTSTLLHRKAELRPIHLYKSLDDNLDELNLVLPPEFSNELFLTTRKKSNI